MKLYIDFEPCDECQSLIKDLTESQFNILDDKGREEDSAKFLRHLTYNHSEVVKGVMKDLTKKKRKEDFGFFQ